MGSGALEAAVYGIPNKGRVKRLEEEITLLRRLWTEEDVSFSGRVYQFEHVTALPRPVQTPPPIWIATNPKRGAASDRVIESALERVGRLGDGYMTDAATVDEFRWRWERVKHYAATAGRDPSALGSSLHLMVNINRDRDGAFDVFRPVSPAAKKFTAERLAAGASLIRDLWWSAWQNSAKPPKRQAPAD